MQARISGGVGNTTIAILAGMAARIEATSGFGSVNVNSTFEYEGKVYISHGYEGAGNRVDLHVTGGIGAINIEYTEGE